MISRSIARPPGRPLVGVPVRLALDESQQRLHSCPELARVERLGEVVVCASGEAFDL
jgi:hypothetical protein